MAEPIKAEEGTFRRFEYKQGNSNKFWEIWKQYNAINHHWSYVTRWGPISANSTGTQREKIFYSSYDRDVDYNKIISSKTKKGYKEIKETVKSNALFLAQEQANMQAQIAKNPALQKVQQQMEMKEKAEILNHEKKLRFKLMNLD